MASSDGLMRMKRLLDELGNPEKDLRVIHIAGTNGKGSTAVMIASILEEAGCSVGLYISPHLETECERIQIWDGTHRMIEQEKLDELRTTVEQAGEIIADDPACSTSTEDKHTYGRLHVFEVYTAAAYLYFRETGPDYVILECGLGGRLDSTNTIEKPLVTVITQVGLDHTAELGRTIFRIAHEKAGIIKSGVPVVSQSMELPVKNILKRTAEEKDCRFIDASMMTDAYMGIRLSMYGDHQIRNAATAAEAVKAAGIGITDEAIKAGLEKAVNPGRFEILSEDPYIIIDGAHNPDAVHALAETVNSFTRSHKIRRTLVIFGCMKDKNYSHMIQLLTGNLKGAAYMTTAVSSLRAEDPEVLGEFFVSNGRSCIVCSSPEEAFSEALSSNYECVLVTGSIYLAGAMRSYFHNNVNHF